jgi:DNA-binding response OmpR family regulator
VSTETHTLLLVGHLPRNLQLLADFLAKEGYATMTATNYEEFDEALNQHQTIAGSLIDIAGFDGQIWTRCERLRMIRVPFLIFSPRQSAEIQQASFSHGARGVMVKPLVVKELITVIRSILEA